VFAGRLIAKDWFNASGRRSAFSMPV